MGIANSQLVYAKALRNPTTAISGWEQVGSLLLAGEDPFRRVFEEAPFGMAVIGLDNKFLKANAALCVLLGYTEQELQERTFSAITYVEDVNKELELTNQVFAGLISHFKIEKRLVAKDGRTVWVNLAATVIRDLHGGPLCGVGIVEDLTEKRRLTEELSKHQWHREP